MAFKLKATLKGYRVLDVRQGTSKAGKLWMGLNLYGDDATLECSTTDETLFAGIRALNPMDVINVDVRAIAGKERSYVVLLSDPQLVESAAVGY